jgi:hypothetical protein
VKPSRLLLTAFVLMVIGIAVICIWLAGAARGYW